MKFIEIPPPIQIVDPKTGEPLPGETLLTFEAFMKETALEDGAFGMGDEALQAAENIEASLDKKPVNWLEVHEADYKYLAHAMKSPQPGWKPALARQCRPFIKAILNAKDERPKLKVVDAAPADPAPAAEA